MAKTKDATRSLPHHEARILQALQLLIETGKVKTTDELIKYCEQAKERTASNYVQSLAEESLPVDLVFDALCVHMRMVAHKRNNALLSQTGDKKIGVVLPLPPHVLDVFLPFEKLTIFLPDGHPIPPFLDPSYGNLAEGGRACRQQVGSQEVMVFEAYREKGAFFLTAGTADILDPRLLKEGVHLVVHLRPHRDPEDIPLTIPTEKLHIL